MVNTLVLTPVSADSRTVSATAVVRAAYPSSSLYPGSLVFPGAGVILTAATADTRTLGQS